MSINFHENALIKVEKIFQDHFLNTKLMITSETNPNDIEEWDSLAHVALLTAVEQQFNVQFTADEMASITSVGAILDTLQYKLGKKP